MPSGLLGQLVAGQDGGDFGSQVFMIKQILAKCNTAELVKVTACRKIEEPSTDPLLLAGAVDVQPMVKLVNGDNESVERGIIYNLPYFRLQGGISSIKIDPAINDIGLAVFCARDISKVKATQEISAPGSWGRFSLSDGLYIGGFLNMKVPVTQYIEFTETGINIVCPTTMTITCPLVNVVGTLQMNGDTVET